MAEAIHQSTSGKPVLETGFEPFVEGFYGAASLLDFIDAVVA